MFTDLVGSTGLAQTDEKAALELIQAQEKLSRPAIADHDGRLVKSTGDGLLVEFSSALDAVECAVDLQRRIHERNSASGARPMAMRIGLHVGDVQRRAGDIFGDAVNVAARVETAAEPGGVCLSEALWEQVRSKVPYSVEKLPPRSLKGVVGPLELYRVVLPWSEAPRPAPTATVPRIAVLPLANISPDPKDEYFADGLTEELISVLSKIPGLRVIARTSVTPYKGSTKSAAEIGSELGVASLLEGSVRKAGERIRVSLQLIDVASQEHLWTGSYDRQLSDVFAIQTEVAESTAKAIRIELSEPAREFLRQAPTTDLAAYELYLRALLREEWTVEGYRAAVDALEEALRRDPRFALAYARLGYLMVVGAGDYLPHREGFARGRELIDRALALDPNLSEAHAALGNLLTQQEHDWPRAEAELETALTLNPSNGTARMLYHTLLRVLGRDEEAERQLWAAIETNPNWTAPRRMLMEVAIADGDLELGRERAERWLVPDPAPLLTHLAFAVGYAYEGRSADAERELELAGPPSTLMHRASRAIILARLGRPEEARAMLEETATRADSSTWPSAV
jgi:adenylate cyclase